MADGKNVPGGLVAEGRSGSLAEVVQINSKEAGESPANTQSQIDQLNLETAQINREIAQAELQNKKEQLANLQFQNEEAAARRERVLTKQRNAAISDERLKQDRERKQNYCNHSQGGEGMDGLFQGEGVHTTYQLETTLTGHKSYRCIRCEDEVWQDEKPAEFAAIKKLPHKGLKGPEPIIFKMVDIFGNQVPTDRYGKVRAAKAA